MTTPKRQDPYKAFNFIVELDGIQSAGFMECSGLSAEITVIEYREGSSNAPIKLPGLRKFSNITLKRGMTQSRDLWQWFKSILQGKIDRRNGSIVILADDRSEVARVNFVSAWPCKWDGPHLNAKAGEVAIETLELTHEGLDLE